MLPYETDVIASSPGTRWMAGSIVTADPRRQDFLIGSIAGERTEMFKCVMHGLRPCVQPVA